MNKSEKKIVIDGPSHLEGEIKISGSKNAVLPILAATLITDEKCIIRNISELTDIITMISMLEILGKTVKRNGTSVTIESSGTLNWEAPYELVKKLRASILVMGALAGRLKKIKVPLPGGCAIGTRPIDLHLKGLKKMGAKYSVDAGFVKLSTKGLKGSTIYLDYPSVGATENLIMAASQIKGETILENAADEPEVLQLIAFIRKMGVSISIEHKKIRINSCDFFKPVDFTVSDDRIQAATYLIAGSTRNSNIQIEYSDPDELESVIEKLIECGSRINVNGAMINVSGPKHLKATDLITTPYPGFPTDLQAPFTAILTQAKGVSVITETIFENRFLHCPELMRMGADIEIKGNSAIVSGVKHLTGAPVCALDLRGGAALIIAGMISKGRTEISGITHIERGYEDIVGNLSKLGAKIWIE